VVGRGGFAVQATGLCLGGWICGPGGWICGPRGGFAV
jgi:hypothetical protein